MKRFMRKFPALAAVLVFAAACDSMVQEPPMGPITMQPYLAGETATGEALVSDARGSVLKLPRAKGYPATTSVTQVIDQTGGQIQLSDFAVLSVSPGAVSQAAKFTVELVQNGFIELRLTAISAKGKKVDIGAQGFSAPVVLRLNTDYASNITEMSVLDLLWEVDGSISGLLVPVAGSLRQGNWLETSLSHFSEYVMASN